MKHNDHYNKMQAEHTAWMNLCERIKILSGDSNLNQDKFDPLISAIRKWGDSFHLLSTYREKSQNPPAKSNKGLETMTPHVIYQFSQASGEREFLVISDLPRDEVLKEHLTPGYYIEGEFIIDEDATLLPCDQRLFHN